MTDDFDRGLLKTLAVSVALVAYAVLLSLVSHRHTFAYAGRELQWRSLLSPLKDIVIIFLEQLNRLSFLLASLDPCFNGHPQGACWPTCPMV
jgi:hypothetical protein